MKNATKSHDHATCKTKNAIFTFLCIFLISCPQISFADTEEYMDYDDFLFDAETLLGKNLKVQAPIFAFDIPSKTINVDFQHLAIDVSQIKGDAKGHKCIVRWIRNELLFECRW